MARSVLSVGLKLAVTTPEVGALPLSLVPRSLSSSPMRANASVDTQYA